MAINSLLTIPTAELLSVHSHADHSIPSDSMPNIHAALGCQDKHTLWVEKSGYNIPREPDRQIVFAAAAQFIKRLSGTDQTTDKRINYA